MSGADTDAVAMDVLLVEDDPGDVLITREALQSEPSANTLHVVPDGSAALDFLRRRGAYQDAPRPDLVLLDLNLPGVGGREVLAEVKADPDLGLIPVVVLTTSAAEEDIVGSYRLHANAYVTKPVDFDAYVELLRRMDMFYGRVVRLPSR